MTDQEKSDNPSFSFMLLIVIASIVVLSIAKQHTRSDAAVGLGACTIALLAAARSRWDLKGKWWFWGALCIGGIVQLPLVLLMPWSDRYLTGFGAMAFVIPGFLMALGCVFLAEKIFASSTAKPTNT